MDAADPVAEERVPHLTGTEPYVEWRVFEFPEPAGRVVLSVVRPAAQRSAANTTVVALAAGRGLDQSSQPPPPPPIGG